MAAAVEAPRRFRRRLFWTLVLTAVLPVTAVAVVGARVLDEVLALSLAPVEAVLERTGASLETAGQPLPESLTQAQLLVAQAELARGALRRLTVGSFVALAVLTLLASVSASVLLGRSFSRPVTALTAGMAALSAGELSTRVPSLPHPERDELAYLIQQFNRMTEQLQAQRARLEVTERLAAWQEVARALAHELKNPLTAMKMALARVARIDPAAPPEQRQTRLSESVALLEDQVDALMRMTQSFSEFARLPSAAPQRLDLAALCADVMRLYAESAPGVTWASSTVLAVSGDADQLRRALANLIKNALEATPPGAPPVEVRAEAKEGTALVTIRDHGPGAPEALLRGRFLEGLSQKPGGSGLGLPITQKIIHQHGGELSFARADGGGTCVTVRLPLVERT